MITRNRHINPTEYYEYKGLPYESFLQEIIRADELEDENPGSDLDWVEDYNFTGMMGLLPSGWGWGRNKQSNSGRKGFVKRRGHRSRRRAEKQVICGTRIRVYIVDAWDVD